MGLTVLHASLIKVLDKLGKEYDIKVLQLRAALEENLAEELSDSRPANEDLKSIADYLRKRMNAEEDVGLSID